MKAFYDHKPAVLEAVGNGSYLYHWDIKQIDNQQWECNEVVVWGPITQNKITEAVITELYPNNYEQKLINEYNSAMMGIGDSSAIEIYKEFLLERIALKRQINDDYKNS